MDMRTGEIGPFKEFVERGVPRRFLRPIGQVYNSISLKNLSPRVRKMVQETGRGCISRNSRCPCGSGKRFKSCCMMAG
ncbi:MAG: SEC-C domain-containing protein [Deltaproteobacteria bacterium]|nr:SEC-C domain-containing protein [Deltaproteobacteria bacterium]